MATYYGPSIAFIVAYLQNVALKKMLRPPSIHFEKCFAPCESPCHDFGSKKIEARLK